MVGWLAVGCSGLSYLIAFANAPLGETKENLKGSVMRKAKAEAKRPTVFLFELGEVCL